MLLVDWIFELNGVEANIILKVLVEHLFFNKLEQTLVPNLYKF